MRVLLAALGAALAAPTTVLVLPVAALVSMPAVAAQPLSSSCRRCCPAVVLVATATLLVPLVAALAAAPATLLARPPCPAASMLAFALAAAALAAVPC